MPVSHAETRHRRQSNRLANDYCRRLGHWHNDPPTHEGMKSSACWRARADSLLPVTLLEGSAIALGRFVRAGLSGKKKEVCFGAGQRKLASYRSILQRPVTECSWLNPSSRIESTFAFCLLSWGALNVWLSANNVSAGFRISRQTVSYNVLLAELSLAQRSGSACNADPGPCLDRGADTYAGKTRV